MKKILFCIFFILLTLNAHSKEQKSINLQLNWLHQFQFAGFYIAKEKGFYASEGLNVNIKEYIRNMNIINEVTGNKSQFAVGRSSILIDKANGIDITALAAIYQKSPLMLLSVNDNIKSIDDFNNKKIMITTDAIQSASIKAMIKSNNISEETIEYMPHSFDLNDLINGKTDLMSCYTSNEPIRLKELGIPYKIFHPSDFGFNFYSDIIFSSTKFIKENPITTKKFYDATIKGWNYAFENKIETAEIIFNKYNTQKKSLMHLIIEANILEKIAKDNQDKIIGMIEESRLENIMSIFKTLGLVNKDIDYDKFIYDENHYNKFTLEFNKKEQKYIVVLSIIIFIFILIIFYLIFKTKKQKNFLDTVINSSEDFIFCKDTNFNYIACNDAFTDLLNLTRDQIIGKSDFDIFDKKFAFKVRNDDLTVIRYSKPVIKVIDKYEYDNKKLYLQSKKVPLINNKKIIGILGMYRDITELQNAKIKLEQMVFIDELTQTLNRKSFNMKIKEHLQMYNRYKNPFCIAMIDIDNFKIVNDTYGHDIGDIVLKNLTKLIQNNIRKTDFFFRIGGEEFLILFPQTTIENAHKALEDLRKKINTTVMDEKNNLFITVSMGLTQIKEKDDTTLLFKRADDNLYYSKRHGKDKITKG